MAFLLPIVEGLEVIGGAIYGAIEGTEAAGAAFAASETAYQAVAQEEAMAVETANASSVVNNAPQYFDIAIDDTDEYLMQEGGENVGHMYDQDWSLLPTEEPDIGSNVMEGYDVMNPFRDYEGSPYYRGVEGSPQYMRLPIEDAYADQNYFADISEEAYTHNVITIGAGKAVFVAGVWTFLDPISGAPVYALAGDDPRVNQIMQNLGYTDNARQAGLVLRHWFEQMFDHHDIHPAGPYTVPVSASRRPRDRIVQPNQSAQESFQSYLDQENTMVRRPNKRTRTQRDYVPVAPSSRMMAIPRPIMLAKARRRPKVSYYTRTLGKIMTLSYWKNAGVVSFSLADPAIAGSSTGGNVNTVGVGWASNSVALAFRLSHFEQYQDLSNSFDQYRMKSVNLTFIPSQDSTIVESTFNSLPTWVMCEDKDDINLGSLVSNAQFLTSKQGNRVKRFDEPFSMRLGPKAWLQDGQLVKSAVTGGWIPCSNFDVLHYGLKFAPIVDTIKAETSPGAGPAYQVTIILKATVECKHAN